MLDHLQAGDEVELPDIQPRDLARHVADVEPARLGMSGSGGDIVSRRVHSGDVSAEPRQGLAHQPGTAADVERGLA